MTVLSKFTRPTIQPKVKAASPKEEIKTLKSLTYKKLHAELFYNKTIKELETKFGYSLTITK